MNLNFIYKEDLIKITHSKKRKLEVISVIKNVSNTTEMKEITFKISELDEIIDFSYQSKIIKLINGEIFIIHNGQ